MDAISKENLITSEFQELISNLPGYEFRPQQLEMVETITQAIENETHAVIEAGTGSGKSFSYLYPVIKNKKSTVISTGTIALQEQLLEKDIPFLKQVGLDDFEAVLAKGRNNYVCKQKLYDLHKTIFPGSPLRTELDLIFEVIDTWDGDFANLPFQISSQLKREIESTSEDCILTRCEFFKLNKAPFYNARKEMSKADIIITNHALYFADVVSGGNVLPEHETVVFDEAHHLYNQAVNSLTISIGRYSITKLLQKIQKRIQPIPESITKTIINAEAMLFEWVFSLKKYQFRLTQENTKGLDSIIKEILFALKDLEQWLDLTQVNDTMFPDEDIKLKTIQHKTNLLKQLDNLMKKWQFIYDREHHSDRVNWVEADNNRGYFELKSAPLFVEEILNTSIWSKKSGILTSATITVKNQFDYFKKKIGLEESYELILESPFNYRKQSALYLPSNIPDPNDKEFILKCGNTMLDILNFSKGRAFLLFASWKNMEIAYDLLHRELSFPHRKQGDMTRKKLIEWFKNTDNSILFATATFWEGIDVPGDSLSCVIIDKLPFSVPDDPVIQAKVEYMKENDMNWFMDFMLPEAIIKLRQGVGRLIRTKTDKGLLVILDNRINTKFYGKTVLRSLPPVTRIKSLRDANIFLND